MFSIQKCPVPTDTLLQKYSRAGSYADCYEVEVLKQISLPDYIFAFYTSPLFKVERLVLALAVSKPSTDIQVRQLADGAIERFAAWWVEDRGENEILLCDFLGRTRSWLMAVSTNTANGARTQLYFGSAVVPKGNSKTGKLSLGFGFHALLGFHRIYSRLLLYFAKSGVARQLSRTA
jgi:hypothetical protein